MIERAWLEAQFPALRDLAPLGAGGQKEVFSAIHPQHGAIVLKLFRVGSDRERVLREARASLELAGPRMPETLESGTMASPVGDILWTFEQRVAGRNLREVLGEGILTDDQAIDLCADLLAVLAVAETCGIVHRDVKPENIILGDDGQFWLIDFGFARHLNLSSLTATARPYGFGTPGYAPPEQFRNVKSEIDGRADLFGLGLTVYEACEGRNPLRHGARDAQEILQRTERLTLPRLTREIGGSQDFVDLIHTMTQTKRVHRPPTVAYAKAWFDAIGLR